jgi:hypothetical protein
MSLSKRRKRDRTALWKRYEEAHKEQTWASLSATNHSYKKRKLKSKWTIENSHDVTAHLHGLGLEDEMIEALNSTYTELSTL